MIYAPVLIPTLCRADHFIRCLESLKKNTWAKYTEVYIAVDYPAKESHWDGYKKIVEYLSMECPEFAGLYVIKRPHNYGAAANMEALRNLVLKKYDRFIRTDDDCEFSANFLEYMDRCLEKYENDESIVGVTGYSYPIDWDLGGEYNAFKNKLIFPMWGTGFWRDKFYKLQKDIKSGCITEYARLNHVKKKDMTTARYLDLLDGTFNYNPKNLTILFSDVACGCYMQLFNKYIITPSISKVRNYGFDGSGVYCNNVWQNNKKRISATNYVYAKQRIDQEMNFSLNVTEKCDFDTNRKKLNQFDRRKYQSVLYSSIRFHIKKIIIMVIGEEKYINIMRKRKNSDGK